MTAPSDNAQDSVELLRRYEAGDASAAEALYERYAARLNALARSRLSAPIRRRLDADDVTQSVYRSFFTRAAEGEFEVEGSGQLWRLLARMTINKVAKKVEQQTAARRNPLREQRDGEQRLLQVAAKAPGPDDLAMLQEQLAQLFAPLNADQRRALEMRLRRYTIEEIAEDVGRTERTIRRWLDDVKRRLTGDG